MKGLNYIGIIILIILCITIGPAILMGVGGCIFVGIFFMGWLDHFGIIKKDLSNTELYSFSFIIGLFVYIIFYWIEHLSET